MDANASPFVSRIPFRTSWGAESERETSIEIGHRGTQKDDAEVGEDIPQGHRRLDEEA